MPTTSEILLTSDATAQARAIASGEISCGELIDLALKRIEKWDGAINAVPHALRLFEQAREQAGGRLPDGPLAGVPSLIKDIVALKGAPATYGSRLLRGWKAKRTEPRAAAFLSTGAIVVGKSTCGEFGLLGTTEPLLWGPTRNPWNLGHSTGGSSGGAAAAVACGMVPVAHATDGGGSIRIPASHCGVFGLKPSRYRGARFLRQLPGNIGVDGCVSRSVRDTACVMACMDRHVQPGESVREAAHPWIGFVDGPCRRRLRLAISTPNLFGREPEDDVRRAVEEAGNLCRELGHEVEVAHPEFCGEEAAYHFLAYWARAAADIRKARLLLRWKARNWRRSDDLEPWTLWLAEWYRAREQANPGVVVRAEDFFHLLATKVAAFYDRYDALITPVARSSAPPLGEHAPVVPGDTLLERCMDHASYTPWHNAIGTPAMSVPLGESDKGLPIGVHVAARQGNERTLLELAYELEAARPWEARYLRLSEPPSPTTDAQPTVGPVAALAIAPAASARGSDTA